MEPENQPPAPDLLQANNPPALEAQITSPNPEPEKPYRGLKWLFIGDQGLRAGWSVAIFFPLLFFIAWLVGKGFTAMHLLSNKGGFTAKSAFFGELVAFIGMVGAAAVVARIEGRSIMDYYLTGPLRAFHFFTVLVVGFAALSALVGALAAGGWLHFGPIALSGADILKYAAVWGGAFLIVGCVEEGLMRCFLLFTLARGLNFWLSLGIIAAICIDLVVRTKGNGVWGVYAVAILGLPPCLMLYMQKAPSAGFWQAAWVTSTLFGFGHTGNGGENWIGIFAAAFIGFVFCVSIKVTGSAWWAIGCHAAWDWAETYFYGTADSGLVAPGHFFSTTLGGNPLWSGGADGPEGSLLVLPIILLLLGLLLAFYGKRSPAPVTVSGTEQLAS